jgi:hypothetical protein
LNFHPTADASSCSPPDHGDTPITPQIPLTQHEQHRTNCETQVARNGDVIRETAWHTRQLAFRFSVPTVYLMSGKLRHIRFAMCTNIFRDTEYADNLSRGVSL